MPCVAGRLGVIVVAEIPTTGRMRLDLTLPSGERATALVSLEGIGVAVNGRACIAHRDWMTAPQLRQLGEYAHELATAIDGPAGAAAGCRVPPGGGQP